MIYSRLPAFVLGFHGCDRSIKEDLISGRKSMRASVHDYDWLGHGMYFWENDPKRALSYAKEIAEGKQASDAIIKVPDVVGAVIDLGYCLNLFEEENLFLLKEGYKILKDTMVAAGASMPKNSGKDEDLCNRKLDCAVIETMHKQRKEDKLESFDSVRAPFWEGPPLYDGAAGFRKKNHIQICVRNPKCIKGFFKPL